MAVAVKTRDSAPVVPHLEAMARSRTIALHDLQSVVGEVTKDPPRRVRNDAADAACMGAITAVCHLSDALGSQKGIGATASHLGQAVVHLTILANATGIDLEAAAVMAAERLGVGG